jgi:hypothetical protein
MTTTIEMEAGPMRNLLAAEPLAGIVTLKFLRNLMDLNPALRPAVERRGVDEFELWQSVCTSVYGAPFAALPMPDRAKKPAAIETVTEPELGPNSPAGGSAVGEALLWTLESCFREDFTPEARHAWETLYRFVNETAWMGSDQGRADRGNVVPLELADGAAVA